MFALTNLLRLDVRVDELLNIEQSVFLARLGNIGRQIYLAQIVSLDFPFRKYAGQLYKLKKIVLL